MLQLTTVSIMDHTKRIQRIKYLYQSLLTHLNNDENRHRVWHSVQHDYPLPISLVVQEIRYTLIPNYKQHDAWKKLVPYLEILADHLDVVEASAKFGCPQCH